MPAAQHVRAGAACSEVFSGPRLAQVLRPALEHQRRLVPNREGFLEKRCAIQMAQKTLKNMFLALLEVEHRKDEKDIIMMKFFWEVLSHIYIYTVIYILTVLLGRIE